jgi:hypothetical protein
VAIIVDETQDEELAKLFALRERLADDEFLAQWKSSPDRAARTLLDPSGPRALLRYTIAIERPERVERQFLFLVHSVAAQLAIVQQPGTQLWLIPQQIAQADPNSFNVLYDLISHCLPIGSTSEPLSGLSAALAHVGHDTPPAPLNRAQRRAQTRKKGPEHPLP